MILSGLCHGYKWASFGLARLSRPCYALPIYATNVARSRSFGQSACQQQHGEYDEQDMKQRREWVSAFESVTLSRDDYQVAFSRSSGPGGQNVNKVSTKANVRLDLTQAGAHAPASLPPSHPKKWLTRQLAGKLAKQSPYYVASDHSLLVTSMRNRTQEANLEDALKKLHQHVLQIAAQGLVGETSEAQKQRVKSLQKAEAARKKHTKIKRADVKSGRRFKG